MASCAKVLLSECVTIGLQLRKHATRCSQVVVWLMWMGLMSAFQTMCEILEKWILSLFVGIFAGVNECSFVQNLCLSRLDLAILWSKVAKNYGIPEIRVFLGLVFGVLWPKVQKIHGVSEIRVFLGRIFGVSLAWSSKELWCFRNLCLSG